MDVTALFWLVLLVLLVQPAIRRRVLEASRKRVLTGIEAQRGSRVILLVHRQETMSLLGFPFFRYIDINDSEQVIRAIDLTDPERPLDLVLHTPGGLVLASLQIARAIQRHKGKVTVVVPHYAMSGGTLIALAADEILMSEHAVLGPVDPQLSGCPAASVLKVMATKPLDKIDDNTLILADQAGKAISQVRDSVRMLLADKHSPEQAERLAALLTEGNWTHDFQITADMARRLGLPVNTEITQDFLNLMGLYPQPVRQQQVEYVPQPYGPPRQRRESD